MPYKGYQKMTDIPELKEILQEKEDSLYAFAKRNNYKYTTVLSVAQRWWSRHDRKPHGGISREILKKMRKEFKTTNPNPTK